MIDLYAGAETPNFLKNVLRAALERIACLELAAHLHSGYNFQVPSVSPTLRVSVLFFGRIRELSGISEETADFQEGATLETVFSGYVKRFPQLAAYRGSLVASRNQEFASWDTTIAAGDEIAFLPPVSGG